MVRGAQGALGPGRAAEEEGHSSMAAVPPRPAQKNGGAAAVTIAGTCVLDAAASAARQMRRQGAAMLDGCGGFGDGPSAAGGNEEEEKERGEECLSTPPRIQRATKMTHRIQNTYGDAEAGGRIMCRLCSKRITIGSAMRRVKRTGQCWHEACYVQAGRGGRMPPKIRSISTLTKRVRKLFGRGDDGSVLCQMCGTEIEIGARMRRATGTGMCWHEQCYRMTWRECLRRAAAPSRPAYKISNAQWKRMRSECLKCAGSRLCAEHRRLEAECRVPREAGTAGAGPAPPC